MSEKLHARTRWGAFSLSLNENVSIFSDEVGVLLIGFCYAAGLFAQIGIVMGAGAFKSDPSRWTVDETIHWVKDVWVNEFEKKFKQAGVDGKMLMSLNGIFLFLSPNKKLI